MPQILCSPISSYSTHIKSSSYDAHLKNPYRMIPTRSPNTSSPYRHHPHCCALVDVLMTLVSNGAYRVLELSQWGIFLFLEVACYVVVGDMLLVHCTFCCFRYSYDFEVSIVIIRGRIVSVYYYAMSEWCCLGRSGTTQVGAQHLVLEPWMANPSSSPPFRPISHQGTPYRPIRQAQRKVWLPTCRIRKSDASWRSFISSMTRKERMGQVTSFAPMHPSSNCP